MSRTPGGLYREMLRDNMSKTQRILGLIYLVIHVVGFPILADVMQQTYPDLIDDFTANTIYYGVGMLVCLCLMWTYLRKDFDVFLDRLGFCIMTVLLGYLIKSVLDLLVSTGVLYLIDNTQSEVLEESAEFVEKYYLPSLAMMGIMAPMIEEPLFRGALFGGMVKKHRTLAYILSIFLYCISHVLVSAITTMDVNLIIIAMMNIPAAYVFAWSYERTGSIWTPIFLHMFISLI